MRQLSDRHREFLKRYIALGDGAAAYKAAGFEAKHAKQGAYALLRKPAIRAELERLRASASAELNADAGWVARQFKDLLDKATGEGDLDVAARCLENLGKITGAYSAKGDDAKPAGDAADVAARLVPAVLQIILPVLSKHGLASAADEVAARLRDAMGVQQPSAAPEKSAPGARLH